MTEMKRGEHAIRDQVQVVSEERADDRCDNQPGKSNSQLVQRGGFVLQRYQ